MFVWGVVCCARTTLEMTRAAKSLFADEMEVITSAWRIGVVYLFSRHSDVCILNTTGNPKVCVYCVDGD